MAELRLYDRSRTVCDWTCPRKRYWNYEYGNGKGIVSGSTNLELWIGTCIHDGLAAIAYQHIAGEVDIDQIATTARKQMYDSLMGETETFIQEEVNFASEQAALVEGLLRGFYRSAWPRLMAQYPDIRCVEQEMHFDHDGLRFMSKPDLVVANPEGDIWYVEYKTTSSKKEGWVNSWNTAVQLHSSIRAIEATFNEKVTGVIVQGLYKGYESYGKQSSPFCYAYRRNGNPPFSQDEIQYEYKAGFKRYPVWELAGGSKAWVEGMPDSVLADQFPQTPPIFVKDDLIDNFFTQRGYREHEIELAMQMMPTVDADGQKNILDVAFPQKFSECVSWWGSKCPYTKLCHGYVEEPLREGFEYRVPHHTPEVEQWNVSPDPVSAAPVEE
jgi:PD-(D/E)XK nuclease superfamily protein